MNPVDMLKIYVKYLKEYGEAYGVNTLQDLYIKADASLTYILDNAIDIRINKRYCNMCTSSNQNRYDIIGGIIPSMSLLREGEYGSIYINSEWISSVCILTGKPTLLIHDFNRMMTYHKPIQCKSDLEMLMSKPSMLNPSFQISVEY